MQILINENQEITAYAIKGGFTNGVEFVGDVPDGFTSSFKSSYYLLKDNMIVVNPNYIEPTPTQPNTGPTTEQVMINQLGLQVATLTKTVAKLQGGATDE